MPTVKAFIRTSSKKDINIRFRYSDGREVQLYHKSEILINPAVFDGKRECVKAKVVFDSEKRKRIDRDINDRKELIKKLCVGTDKSVLTSEWLESAIDKELHPDRYIITPKIQPFFEAFEEFLKVKKFSNWRYRAFNVVIRALKRYEMYVQITSNGPYLLELNNITPKTLSDLSGFLQNEYLFSEQYSELYEKVPESRKPEPRGQNTVNGFFTKMRTFFIWAVDNEKTENNPFRKFAIEECVYGTPYYISIDERNQLYGTDLSYRPALAIQRDIFVFQCLIGCRVLTFTNSQSKT